MARQEIEREDLLRDATALVERIELAPVQGEAGEHVVVGFRANGALSIYFGSEPAYHFNSGGRLRRAYDRGLLFKADRGRLVSLKRERRENETQLVRHELSDEEQEQFLRDMHARVRYFVELQGMQRLVSIGQVPADADVLNRAMRYLYYLDNVKIADSPRAK